MTTEQDTLDKLAAASQDCAIILNGNMVYILKSVALDALATANERIRQLQADFQNASDAADEASERIARLEGVATAALRRARAALSVAIRAAVEDIDFDPQEHHAIKDIDAALAALSPAETG